MKTIVNGSPVSNYISLEILILTKYHDLSFCQIAQPQSVVLITPIWSCCKPGCLTSDLWICPAQCPLVRRGDLYSFRVHLTHLMSVRWMNESRWEELSCLYTRSLQRSRLNYLGKLEVHNSSHTAFYCTWKSSVFDHMVCLCEIKIMPYMCKRRQCKIGIL